GGTRRRRASGRVPTRVLGWWRLWHRSRVLDPGVDEGVGHIDEQVHESEHDGDEQHAALDDRVVTGGDGVVDPAADARPTEDGLREQSSGEQGPEAEADDGYHREQRVPQRVYTDHSRFMQSFGARGADVVLAEDVE